MGKRIVSKENVIKNKKESIKNLNRTLETLINSRNSKHLKKADLIAYWIKEYSNYLMKEERFDYSKVLRFKRGDVIRVNFGFNVGSEQGGLHYAVVLDNDNKKSSPVITVLPLSSGSEEAVYDRDVFLGNELYESLMKKYEKLKTQIEEEISNASKKLDIIKSDIDNLRKNIDDQNIKDKQSELSSRLNENQKEIEKLQKELDTLEIYAKEIGKLKVGSIALIEQITTISKMRIYNPKSRVDLLFGIKLSESTMNKINEKLKKIFIFGD